MIQRRLAQLALGATIVALTGLAISGASRSVPTIPDNEAAELAYRLDKLLDAIPEQTIEVTPVAIKEWTFEILPFFEYEGIVGAAIRPESVLLTPYLEAMEHSHVLGRAYCTPAGGGPVEINARVANKRSAWYGRPSFLATLVHELGHIQGGGLCSDNSDETESTTQLVTLEVLAAIANGGNGVALLSVLDELRDMLMGAVHYEALLGKIEGWEKFRAEIYSDTDEIARSEKSKRRWRSDPALLKEILYKYSWIPVQKILKGLPEQKIPRLLLGEPEWDGELIPYGAPQPRPLEIDDLAYVIEHAEELVEPIGGTLGPNRPKAEQA